MTKEDKKFLSNIEDKEFHDALIRCFPDGIPESIKEPINRCYVYPYDAGATCDDLHGCTEYPD